MEYQLNFCHYCKTLIYYNKAEAGWYHLETEAVWCHWKGPNKHRKRKATPEDNQKRRKEKS